MSQILLRSSDLLKGIVTDVNRDDMWLNSLWFNLGEKWMYLKLSTSIYVLMLLNVCHFHHPHHHQSFPQIRPILRYSCLYLESLHPRILKTDICQKQAFRATETAKMAVIEFLESPSYFDVKSDWQQISKIPHSSLPQWENYSHTVFTRIL